MSRGFGIKVDEDEVGPRPSGVGQGIIRTFSTELPQFSNAAQIQAGKQLQQVGEEIFARASMDLTEKQAKEVQIGIDPETGEYTRPQTPFMGMATREVYDKIVDQTFTEKVYRDFEGRANEIAAQHFQDPEASGKLMSELATAMLGKVREPHLQNALAPIFQREINERQRSVHSTRARMDYSNILEHSKEMELHHRERALSAYRIGDNARGDEEWDLADGQKARRVAMGDEHPDGLALTAVRKNELKNTGTFLNLVNHDMSIGKMTPQDFDMLDVMLNGGGSDEVNWNGITKADLFKKIPTERERQQLRVRLNQIKGDYFQKQAATSQARSVIDYPQSFATRGGKPRDWSDAEDAQRTEAHLQMKGLDPLSGQGVQYLHNLRGDLPESYYKEKFKDVANNAPDRLVKLAETWNTMQTLVGPEGNKVGAPAGMLSDPDAAFMTMFSRLYAGATGDAKEKAREAHAMTSKLIEKGEKTLSDASSNVDFVVKQRQILEGGQQTGSAIYKDIQTALPGIDGGQQELVATSIAGLMARAPALSYAQAKEQAVARFTNTHQQSQLILSSNGKAGGYVQRDFAVPMIADGRMNGQQTDQWVAPYVKGLFQVNRDGSTTTAKVKTGERMVNLTTREAVEEVQPTDPLIPREQYGHKLTNPEIGKNVFLIPTGRASSQRVTRPDGTSVIEGDPQFALAYVTPDGNVIPELRTKSGQVITLRLGEAARYQDGENRKSLTGAGVQDPRYQMTAGAQVSPDGQIHHADPAYAAARGRVNPTMILDLKAPAPRGRPWRRPRRRRCRVGARPRRCRCATTGSSRRWSMSSRGWMTAPITAALRCRRSGPMAGCASRRRTRLGRAPARQLQYRKP